LLLSWKKLFGSYFFLIWASLFRFRPNALATPHVGALVGDP